jgi:Flp pilus assembly protein TadB
MTYTIRFIGPILAAISLSGIIFWLLKTVRIERGASRQLSDFQGEGRLRTRGDELGEKVAKKLPLSIETWENHLQWAQRAGYYPGWGVGRLVFTALLYATIASILLLINPAPISLFAPALAIVYPFLAMRSKANRVRRQAGRGLPEIASLIAAELAAGVPPEQALSRSALLPGPVPVLIAEAIALSQRTGQPLFSRRDGGLKLHGSLFDTFTAANVPAVRSFAAQLDRVSEKGVAGAAQMSRIAQAMAQEYRQRLMSETKKLDSRLVLATALFFFIPFVVVILGSFMLPILQMF